jgi:Uma2 family endonuclease
MARRHAIIADENLRIPEDASTYDGFLRWSESDEFPETGRIDYLEGEIDVDMSPEDLYTHSAVKTAVSYTLAGCIVEADLGDVFIDSTQIRSRFVQMAAEPDIVVALDSSMDSGQVRPVPSPKKPGSFRALEGAPDIVVEIVSDSSVKKDYDRRPPLFSRAGIPELWLIDARQEDLRFAIHSLRAGDYALVPPDADGWITSPRLGHAFRLVRWRRPTLGTWRYKLEIKAG